MDFFEHPYYRMVNMFLTITGQWPHASNLHAASIVILLLVVGTIGLAPLLMALVKYYDDMVMFLQSILAFIVVLILFAKVLCFKWNLQKMLKLLYRIRADWQVWTRHQEMDILHDYAEEGRKMMLAWVVLFTIIGVVFSTQPAVPKILDILMNNGSKPGEFPVPVDYYYFDEQKYYFYLIAHMFLSVCFSFFLAMTYDCMFIAVVQHGCGIFAALGHKLSEIGKSDKSAELMSGSDKQDFRNLAWCIERHHDAIEYADLIESAFSWSFFLTVGLNVLVISISGYQIAKNTASLLENGRYLVSIVATSGNICFESYMAQILMDHSISIQHSIHRSNWYNKSLRVQKLMYFMMIRCDVCCQLTAGKMGVMCLETFVAIMKTSLSCLTVLRSV